MTSAYIAQVKTGECVFYIGKKGLLTPVPVFWSGVGRLQRVMNRGPSYFGLRKIYNAGTHADAASVIRTDSLELGLQSTTATIMTPAEFLALSPIGKSAYTKQHTFRLRLANGKWANPNGGGWVGKMWSRAGDVRAHLSNNMHRLLLSYRDAIVYVYLHDQDGVNISLATKVPVIEFLRQSPICAKRWTDYQAQLKPVMTGNIAGVLAKGEFV